MNHLKYACLMLGFAINASLLCSPTNKPTLSQVFTLVMLLNASNAQATQSNQQLKYDARKEEKTNSQNSSFLEKIPKYTQTRWPRSQKNPLYQP